MLTAIANNTDERNYQQVKFMTVFSIMYYGFLRSSELTGLRRSDVKFEDNTNTIIINIRISKTDQAAQGIKCFIPHSSNIYGPHKWLPIYLKLSDHLSGESKLFTSICTQTITLQLRRRLAFLEEGIDVNAYSSHSLRKGGATQAAKKGIQDSVIQRHGRWNSTCFMVYTMVERRHAGNEISKLI